MKPEIIDRIKTSAANVRDELARNHTATLAFDKSLIDDIEKALLGETDFDEQLIQRIKSHNSYAVRNLLQLILFPHYYEPKTYPWSVQHPLIRSLIQRKYISENRYEAITDIIHGYVYQHLTQDPDLDINAFTSFLSKQGFSEEDIIAIGAQGRDCFYFNYHRWARSARNNQTPPARTLTPFAQYLLPLLKPSSGFLGFGKKSGAKKIVDDLIFAGISNGEHRTQWLDFLTEHYPDAIDNYAEYLTVPDSDKKRHLNISAAYILIEKDAARHEPAIQQVLKSATIDAGHRFGILMKLNEKLNGKYNTDIETAGEAHLFTLSRASQPVSYYETRINNTLLTEVYLDYLFQKDPTRAKARLEQFFKDALALNQNVFPYVQSKLESDALLLLIEALRKSPEHISKYDLGQYYPTLFALLEKHELQPHKKVVTDFAIAAPTKNARELACKTLSAITDIIPDAQALLSGRTVDQRVIGALILSHLDTPLAQQALNDAVDTESNDDTRDIMLEALEKKFVTPFSFSQVKEMITLAASRKKLNKWNEKWLEEAKLPALYFRDSGNQLTLEEVRFLFYRMKRATGLNSDIEARQLLNQIDRERSAPFAKALLLAFQDSNADTKMKYYLTLAALLGDDDMMHNLNTLFKKSMTDKRGKMAEYVVGALAMVGSDKALRLVEVIYRKYAAKKPAVSQAARAALDAAAAELNISMDELADRIIPNFDFNGIYKNIQIEGEEYRAFINAEFKLNFLNEDNKIRKSLPANAPKELKAEFKEIEKEINDVVKSQSGRLEKYMTEERRWSTENWRTFFFNNPIMFVYALKVLWGVYNKEGELVNSFYCSEDTSLYDVNDEELAPGDDVYIGILHPCHLTSEQLEKWKDKVYTLSMITIFPILDRPVFRVAVEEQDNSLTKNFYNQEVPKGADFVNTFLPKCNWIKSTGDGGHSEFTKQYKDGLVRAYANIEGPAAWYQGGTTPAKVYEISFMRKNWQDKIALKELPPVFYSEVCADIYNLIQAN